MTTTDTNTPSPRCPVCETAGAAEYCRKSVEGKTWRVHRCSRCGFGFVANRPSMDQLREIYAGVEHYKSQDKSDLRMETGRDYRRVASRMAKLVPGHGAALDVGCGNGGYSLHLKREGFGPLMMIDLDSRGEEAANRVPGSEFRLCAFEDLHDVGPFSAMVMSQILEHALDPMAWLKHAYELLAPGGVLVIGVPNFGGVYRLLGTRDPMITPPVHLNFFTAGALRQAVERAGMEVRAVQSDNRVRISPNRGFMHTAARRAWTVGSRLLDPTPYGIILTLFAQRPVAS